MRRVERPLGKVRAIGVSNFMPEHVEKALEKSAEQVIQKTHWPNIDLIGAQLNLYWAEFQIPVWRMASRG